jgi:hypothetical protein
MPRQNPGATQRRRSADRFRTDVQLATPQIVAASIAAGSAFDTSDVDFLSVELRLHEFLVTSLTGTNNDLAIIARDPAVTDVTVALVDPSDTNQSLSVEVTDHDIVVNLATDGAGAITSTAAQVAAAIAAHAAAKELVVVANASGNDGTGVVTALAETGLAGPGAVTIDADVETMADTSHWYDAPGSAIPQATAVGVYRKVFGPLGWQSRINLTVGGTPPAAVSTYVIGHA